MALKRQQRRSSRFYGLRLCAILRAGAARHRAGHQHRAGLLPGLQSMTGAAAAQLQCHLLVQLPQRRGHVQEAGPSDAWQCCTASQPSQQQLSGATVHHCPVSRQLADQLCGRLSVCTGRCLWCSICENTAAWRHQPNGLLLVRKSSMRFVSSCDKQLGAVYSGSRVTSSYATSEMYSMALLLSSGACNGNTAAAPDREIPMRLDEAPEPALL